MIATLLFALLVQAGGAPKPVVSPDVDAEGKVTFRVRAPKAEKVVVSSGELKPWLGAGQKELEKDATGVWSLTIGPVAPGIYDYTFEIDGLRTIDMASDHVFGNRRGARGYVDVPGPKDKPRLDEWREVPHGALTAHWYVSAVAGGARRRVHVYTPPGYAKETDKKYPVLYLLHGSGDNDSHWAALGQANVIADNLIAEGKAERMIIAMTDGHVNGSKLPPTQAYERDLLDHVIPLVEAEYRVKAERESRGIVGLSMGGGQSLWAGLRNLDKFAWVGAFSAATKQMEAGVPEAEKDAAKMNAALKLLWIRIGKDDFLLETNRKFIAMLKETGVKHDYVETPGAHMWSVWRGYLGDFLPLLFKG